MNVSEYLVSFLEEKEIDHVFGVVGGAILWICKALSENKNITPVFTNHEQAATMAADGWARTTGKPGVVFTINGPGMTNTVTGIAQAWVDSSPIILITGNSNSKSVSFERANNMRQYGTQDVRTDKVMEEITKKTFFLDDPQDAGRVFEEAYELCLEGRPGPVCIEIPINIQSAEVQCVHAAKDQNLREIKKDYDLSEIVKILSEAKRPLILAGQGIRMSNSISRFRQFVSQYQIPVVNSRMGIDSIESSSELFVGRCGNHGSRASHFAIQTCDVLLVIGSRLAPNTTGYDVSRFSNQSYKILIELDESELEKYQLNIDRTINIDIRDFLSIMCSENKTEYDKELRKKWIECCNLWKNKYPIMQPEYYSNPLISTYYVVEKVSEYAKKNDVILSDTGSCCSIVAQTWDVKENQKVYISGGLSAMGYWATSIGVAVANNGSNTICFVGDGSLQMNIHELATIKAYNLSIKLFVINNGGYQFVKMSQGGYGINPPFGTDIEGGVPLPDNKKVVEAYGIEYVSCNSLDNLDVIINKTFETNGPIVCEIFVDDNQEVCPRLKSIALSDGSFVSPNYENLYPFIDEESLKKEINQAMI